MTNLISYHLQIPQNSDPGHLITAAGENLRYKIATEEPICYLLLITYLFIYLVVSPQERKGINNCEC